MNIAGDGEKYELTIDTVATNEGPLFYKFVLANGEWVLLDGQPTVCDENGVLNHQLEIKSTSTNLDEALDAALDPLDRRDGPDHATPAEAVHLPADLGTEVISKQTTNNEYPSSSPTATDSGNEGDAMLTTVATSSRSPSFQDHHLNPAAPAFNPSAAPFVPSSIPLSDSKPVSRSSRRQRSHSRSRTAHSRSRSVASHRPSSGSISHHDELNPAANVFKPQFAQPTHIIPHASGYAAALKKPASPPLKEDFKKPRAPSTKPSASGSTSSFSSIGGDGNAVQDSHIRNGSSSSVSASYAEMAKHAAARPKTPVSTSSARTAEASKSQIAEEHGAVPTFIAEQAGTAFPAQSGEVSDKLNSDKVDTPEDDDQLQQNHKKHESRVEELVSESARDRDVSQSDTRASSECLMETPQDDTSAVSTEEVSDSVTPDGSRGLNKQEIITAEAKSSPTKESHLHDDIAQIDPDLSERSPAVETHQHVEDVTATEKQPAKDASDMRENGAPENSGDEQQDVLSKLQNSGDIVSGARAAVNDTIEEIKATIANDTNGNGNASHDMSSNSVSGDLAQEHGVATSSIDTVDLTTAHYDSEQIRLMEEVCILLDRDDNPIGSASKKDAHLMSNINEGLLHRAFSLFIFNYENKLLLQQRATEKITFPDMWTNTCCSHPLSTPGEVADDLQGSIAGVKRAAQRKVEQELGILANEAPIEEMRFLTRIHYLAPSDGRWGEHEIDYILLLRADPQLSVNPNEVRDHKWVSQDDLRSMFASSDLSYTPWFKLICETFLYKWWNNLSNISVCVDEPTIHRLGIEAALFNKIAHTESSPNMLDKAVGQDEEGVAVALQKEIPELVSGASNAASSVLDKVSDATSAVVEPVRSSISPSEEPAKPESSEMVDLERTEPAAEDTLPLTDSDSPEFTETTIPIQPDSTSAIVGSKPVTETSEPAAEGDGTLNVETSELLEPVIHGSLKGTTSNDDTGSSRIHHEVPELSQETQAKQVPKGDSTASSDFSRPSTGKSIRPKPNFFIFLFNSLFGGIFSGLKRINFSKLAFWRRSAQHMHPHSD